MKPTPEMVQFLDAEIKGLKSRIGASGNAVQHDKLEMLSAIRSALLERRNAGAA